MTENLKFDPDLVPTHTTAATTSIARWVEQHYCIQVQQCHLIRRGPGGHPKCPTYGHPNCSTLAAVI